MNDTEQLLDSLDNNLSTQQLAQLCRLLDSLRSDNPQLHMNTLQAGQRSRIIGRAVVRIRGGMTDAELEIMLHEVKKACAALLE